MFRKSVVVLLIGTWVNLSGVDWAQDLELPGPVGLDSAGKESPPRAYVANDRLESAELATLYHPAIFQLPEVHSQLDDSTATTKVSKIYKLLRVLLI